MDFITSLSHLVLGSGFIFLLLMPINKIAKKKDATSTPNSTKRTILAGPITGLAYSLETEI